MPRRRYYVRMWRAWLRVPFWVYRLARRVLPVKHSERIARYSKTR